MMTTGDDCAIFVDVDTQRDFIDPDGALYVPDSVAIRPNLARLTAYARNRAVPVLATACAHLPGDPELETFPPHCMVGTRGQTRIDETSRPDSRILGPDALFAEPRLPAHLTVEKREYDVFSHPSMNWIVETATLHSNAIFVVYGVATDYCVGCAARGLLERGHRVLLVVDAIRGIDQERETEVLTDLVSRGATLALTAAVCDDFDTRHRPGLHDAG